MTSRFSPNEPTLSSGTPSQAAVWLGAAAIDEGRPRLGWACISTLPRTAETGPLNKQMVCSYSRVWHRSWHRRGIRVTVVSHSARARMVSAIGRIPQLSSAPPAGSRRAYHCCGQQLSSSGYYCPLQFTFAVMHLIDTGYGVCQSVTLRRLSSALSKILVPYPK